MVERQLAHRRIALANMVNAQFAGSKLTAIEPLLPVVHPVGRARRSAHCSRSPARFRLARSLPLRCCSAAHSSRSKASSAPGRRSPRRARVAYRLSAYFENRRTSSVSTPRSPPRQGLIEVEEVGVRGPRRPADPDRHQLPRRARARSSESSARAGRERRRSARSWSAPSSRRSARSGSTARG